MNEAISIALGLVFAGIILTFLPVLLPLAVVFLLAVCCGG
jgi:hypothetical protein